MNEYGPTPQQRMQMLHGLQGCDSTKTVLPLLQSTTHWSKETDPDHQKVYSIMTQTTTIHAARDPLPASLHSRILRKRHRGQRNICKTIQCYLDNFRHLTMAFDSSSYSNVNPPVHFAKSHWLIRHHTLQGRARQTFEQ